MTPSNQNHRKAERLKSKYKDKKQPRHVYITYGRGCMCKRCEEDRQKDLIKENKRTLEAIKEWKLTDPKKPIGEEYMPPEEYYWERGLLYHGYIKESPK